MRHKPNYSVEIANKYSDDWLYHQKFLYKYSDPILKSPKICTFGEDPKCAKSEIKASYIDEIEIFDDF